MVEIAGLLEFHLVVPWAAVSTHTELVNRVCANNAEVLHICRASGLCKQCPVHSLLPFSMPCMHHVQLMYTAHVLSLQLLCLVFAAVMTDPQED